MAEQEQNNEEQKLYVDKCCEELKHLYNLKQEMMLKKTSLDQSIKGGRDYFGTRLDSGSAKDLRKGAERMCSLIDEYSQVMKDIQDIDLIIISKLEAYTGNFIPAIKTSRKVNDAGDLINPEIAWIVPFTNKNSSVTQISPDDIWFLKMVKEAYKPANIKICLK